MVDTSDSPTPGVRARAVRFVLYAVIVRLVRLGLTLVFRTRVFGAHHVPGTGGVLLICNHQSNLDPPAVSSSVTHRQLSFVAKEDLFRNRLGAWLFGSLNSIPLKLGESDARAIKQVVHRLRTGNAVLIFPEGTRTPNGRVQPFKRGMSLLVKRSACPVVPVAIEGPFDIWPKGGKMRLLSARIAVRFGRPIDADELMRDGPDAALARMASEIEAMRLGLRRVLRRHTNGRYPPAGPGDTSDPRVLEPS